MNNYTYKQIWLVSFPVMTSILMEQLINITDAAFLGRVGTVELGAAGIAGLYCWDIPSEFRWQCNLLFT